MPGPVGMPGAGGGAWSWGVCLVETPQTATAAGGTHPTGMHSCSKIKWRKNWGHRSIRGCPPVSPLNCVMLLI